MTAASLTSEPEKLMPTQADKDTAATFAHAAGIGLERFVANADLIAKVVAYCRLSSPVSGTDHLSDRLRALVEQVEAGQFDKLEAVADKWVASAGIQRMSNAICSVFEKYAPQDVMDRFREKVAATMHLSFVEGAAQGVLQHKATSPTPPIPMIAEAGERERLIGGGIVLYARGGYAVRPAGEPFPPTADAYTFYPLPGAVIAALSTPATLDNTAVEGQEAISDAVHGALWDADAENERLRAALTRIEQFVRDFRAPWGSWKTAWWEGEVFDDAAFTEDNALMHIANVASATLTAKTEKAE